MEFFSVLALEHVTDSSSSKELKISSFFFMKIISQRTGLGMYLYIYIYIYIYIFFLKENSSLGSKCWCCCSFLHSVSFNAPQVVFNAASVELCDIIFFILACIYSTIGAMVELGFAHYEKEYI